MAAAIRVSPAMAPTTMPAMAPPDRELELEPDATGARAALVDEGVEDLSAGADEAVESMAVELAAELRVDEVLVVLDVTLEESEPPRTCARRTMPTFDVQQSFDDPQHHRSLVAVPSHGTMGVLPTEFFVCWQTFRQPSDETSLLVQKSTHYSRLVLTASRQTEKRTYDTFPIPLTVSRFWHRPFGRHSSLVKPFAGSPFDGFDRLMPQHIELPGQAWYSRYVSGNAVPLAK